MVAKKVGRPRKKNGISQAEARRIIRDTNLEVFKQLSRRGYALEKPKKK